MDEDRLVFRCLSGDTSGFEVLIKQHEQRLRGLLIAMLNDPFDAEDAFQETLLRAYLNLDQLRVPSKFGAWIYTIAINMARSIRASGTSSRPASLEEFRSEAGEDDLLPDTGSLSSESLLVQREESRQVRQAIDNLSPAEREAVMLVYLDGLSHKEVAEHLGASLSAVKVRIHRGKRHLRAYFSNQAVPVPALPMEVNMLEVKIHDVLIHFTEARNDLSAKVTDEAMKKTLSRLDQSRRYVVLLKEVNGNRTLPIWIGAFEAEAIVLSLKQAKIVRPLTFDLMKTLLGLGDLQVTRIEISRLHETVFYANLIVKTRDGVSEIDCRPSDALNLAVRLEVPVFVAAEVMQANSQMPTQDGTYIINPDDPEMIWESLINEAAT